MRKLAFALCLGSMAMSAVATADSYDEKLKEYKLTKMTRLYELAEFVGNRVFQLQGTIQGVCTSDTGALFTIETPEGGALQVSCPMELPEWMLNNNVTAKFIVRIEKVDENSAPQGYLISAKQSSLEKIGVEPGSISKPAPKKPQPTAQPPKTGRNGRPAPMGGSIQTSRGGASSRSGSRDWALTQSEAMPYYRDFILKQNRRLAYGEAEQIASAIIGFSIRFDVDARLVTALVMSESNFNPRDVSHVGAAGLGQLMPDTARELGVTNRFDTEENLYATIKLLKSHMDKYTARTGSASEGLRLALAAYNAGPGAVKKHGGVPPYRETQNYVRKVVRIYRELAGLD